MIYGFSVRVLPFSKHPLFTGQELKRSVSKMKTAGQPNGLSGGKVKNDSYSSILASRLSRAAFLTVLPIRFMKVSLVCFFFVTPTPRFSFVTF